MRSVLNDSISIMFVYQTENDLLKKPSEEGKKKEILQKDNEKKFSDILSSSIESIR